MCKISLNDDLNGIELMFDNKPEQDVITAIKAQGFRWNNKKRIWYARQTAERLTFAESLGTLDKVATPRRGFDLENLGQNAPALHGKELSGAIRADLKKRGITGCSVRVKWSGYTAAVTVTYKAAADDFASIEEARARFSVADFVRILDHGVYIEGDRPFNGHYIYYNDYEAMDDDARENIFIDYIKKNIIKLSDFSGRGSWDHNYYFGLSISGYEKLRAIWLISNQWNYDRSDSMSDYFDIGYYLDIDIKHPDGFTVRESMTDEERAAFEDEQKKIREEEAAAVAKYEQERAESEKRTAEYKKWSADMKTRIYNNIRIDDLLPQDCLYITDCAGGIGKESSLEELDDTLKDRDARRDCLIDRIVTFTDAEAFAGFCKMFLHDFDFLANKGGTGSEDRRCASYDDFLKLTPEQRESIHFYNNNCVGIVYNDIIQLIIDPQGYDYARYVHKMTDDSKTLPAAPELERQRRESEGLTDFYIPAPVEDQVKNIKPGQDITIYQSDGWILNDIYAGQGTVQDIRAGKWAQHNGVYIDFEGGRSVFIHNGRDCLIYNGIVKLPHEVTQERVNGTMVHVLTVFEGLFSRVYNYFYNKGVTPILDTIAK